MEMTEDLTDDCVVRSAHVACSVNSEFNNRPATIRFFLTCTIRFQYRRNRHVIVPVTMSICELLLINLQTGVCLAT
jgi:hypothetical protein